MRVVPKRGETDKRYEAKVFKVSETGGFFTLTVDKTQKKKGEIKSGALLVPILIFTAIFLYFFGEQVLPQFFGKKHEVESEKKEKASGEKRGSSKGGKGSRNK